MRKSLVIASIQKLEAALARKAPELEKDAVGRRAVKLRDAYALWLKAYDLLGDLELAAMQRKQSIAKDPAAQDQRHKVDLAREHVIQLLNDYDLDDIWG